MLRTIIIVLASPDDKPAEKRFFANARMDDMILLPVYTAQWIVIFVLLLFLDYATFDKRFSHDWLTRQLLALSGFNVDRRLCRRCTQQCDAGRSRRPRAAYQHRGPAHQRDWHRELHAGRTLDHPFAHFDVGSGAMEAFSSLGIAAFGSGTAIAVALNVSTLVSRRCCRRAW